MSRPMHAHNPAVSFQTPPQALEPILPYLRPQVIVMGRVRFTTPTGLQGMDSNPTFGVCWLTWKLELPHDLMWWHEGDLR
jgi:hypothetical protein